VRDSYGETMEDAVRSGERAARFIAESGLV
jgi:hypothetical protein